MSAIVLNPRHDMRMLKLHAMMHTRGQRAIARRLKRLAFIERIQSLAVDGLIYVEQTGTDCDGSYGVEIHEIPARIEAFVSGWQSLTGAPFIFADTASKQFTYWNFIHTEQGNLGKWDRVTEIDTSDLTLWDDNLHFDTRSQLTLGHRMYLAANP